MKTFYLILLVLFPSISFASSSSADYVFLVENTAMVDSYYNIFNALASIFQSESYMDLLKLAFLFGGFLMLTKGVFATYEGSASAKMISEYGKYLATVVGLLVIISGKSTIWITTNNIPTYCSTSSPTVGTAVDNIPSVLAYSFTVANTIGNGLTELAESGFTNATESTMTKSDGYLGNLKETIKVLTLDPSKTSVENDFDFTNMWSVFFSDCVYMPSINQGQEGAKVLSDAYKTKDLLNYSETLMGHTFSEGASISQIGDSTVKYMGQTYTCSAFLETLKSLTNTHLSNFTCTLPLANSGVLELITGNVNSGATGASEMNGIARQAGLITAFKGSKAINSIGIQGADSFTGGTTKASFNMSSLSSASYMADMMPYVQMTLRAVLYAFFPFIFVVIILPGGLKVLAQYAKTLIWIELWTPTAAILHMFVSIHAKDKLSTMYSNSTGVTLMNSIDMLSETATLAGVGAMLYVSVPAITWLMITGSGQMLGNVMSGVGASFQSQLKSDQSGMELAKDLQRQKINQERAHNSEGRNAALSYGEMMFYENLQKGHMDTGTFMSNKDYMDKGGDISEKTNAENNSRIFDALAKKEEMSATGAVNEKGINLEKTKQLASLKGHDSAVDMMSKMEKYDANKDGHLDKKEFNTALTEMTKKEQFDAQKNMQYGNQMEGKGSMAGTASSVSDLTNFLTTLKTNKEVSPEEKSTANSNQDIIKTKQELKTMDNLNNNERIDSGTKEDVKKTTAANAEMDSIEKAKRYGTATGNMTEVENITKEGMLSTYDQNSLVTSNLQKQKTEVDTNLKEIRDGYTPDKKSDANVLKTGSDIEKTEKFKQEYDSTANTAVKLGTTDFENLDRQIVKNEKTRNDLGTGFQKEGGKADSYSDQTNISAYQQKVENGINPENEAKNTVSALNQSIEKDKTNAKSYEKIINEEKGKLNGITNEVLKNTNDTDRYTKAFEISKGAGIFNPEITKSALQSDFNKIEKKEQFVNSGLKEEEKAIQNIEKAIAKEESNGGNKKIIDSLNKGLNSHKEKKHSLENNLENLNLEKAQTIHNYASSGAIKFNTNENGETDLAFADTMKDLASKSDEDKQIQVQGIQGKMSGLTVNTVDYKGMTLNQVRDLTGHTTTDVRKAEHTYLKSNNSNLDAQYYAVNSGIVDASTTAGVNMGLKYINNVSSLYLKANSINKIVNK